MANTPTVTLGLLGKYYSVRHTLGHYRSACVTGVYSLPSPSSSSSLSSKPQGLQNALESSLQATIRRHPGLSYAISDQAPDGNGRIPGFKQVRTIRREDVMEFVDCSHSHDASQPPSTQAEADTVLCEKLQAGHSQLWPVGRPAWRVTLLFHLVQSDEEADSPSARLDIIFMAHHALADGLSGIAFHKSLMAELAASSETSDTPAWPLVLSSRDPPLPIEHSVAFSPPAAAPEAAAAQEDDVWTGGVISQDEKFKSRVQLVMIPSSSLVRLLQHCKQQGSTLTSHLHGAICASLSHAVPGPSGFRAVTPYSVRKWTRTGPGEIVNHISYVTTHVDGPQLEAIRNSVPRSNDERKHTLDLSRNIGTHIASQVQRLPRGSALAALSQIQDMWTHCASQVGQKRQDTYELSNLGAVEKQDGSPLGVERLIFTQCGMVAGPAMGFSCVSVRGGPLTIAITWQEGIVDESLIQLVAQTLKKRLI